MLYQKAERSVKRMRTYDELDFIPERERILRMILNDIYVTVVEWEGVDVKMLKRAIIDRCWEGKKMLGE